MWDRIWRDPLTPGALAAILAALALLGPLAPVRNQVLTVVLGLAAFAAALYIGWRVHPAYTLSAGLMLSVMAGNWGLVGVPGVLAPDRLLFVGGIAAVMFRAPAVADRPALRFGAVHWAMVVALAWAVGTAIASGSISDKNEMFEILERFGVIPFLLFLVAPVAFATHRDRNVLVTALVALGAYLGLTALSEAVNGPAFPSIINDPSVGIHADRARGPFLEAVTNGAGLFACITGAGIAVYTWTGSNSRRFALGVLALCGVGLLFTETRSVWIGGVLAAVAVLLFVREFHRYILPAIIVGVVGVGGALALVPGLAESVQNRKDSKGPVWDRKNLATAALGMTEAHPLTGVGWGQFTKDSQDYFRQSQDFPLTANRQVIHNVFLTYAAEIGLVGLSLWLLALFLGMVRALRGPPGPEAFPWKVAVGAYLVFFLTISNFVFAQVFPNDMIWLLAGVAVGAGGAGRAVTANRTPAIPEPRRRVVVGV